MSPLLGSPFPFPQAQFLPWPHRNHLFIVTESCVPICLPRASDHKLLDNKDCTLPWLVWLSRLGVQGQLIDAWLSH